MRKHKLVLILLTVVFALMPAIPAAASSGGVPYRGYTYDYWGFIVPSPAAYVPTISIGARDVDASLGSFKGPEDMYVDKNGYIYLMDTGNNRLVIFDKHLELLKVIDSFENNGQTDHFNTPSGVCVTDDLDIYIADTNNRRIVALDAEGALIKIFENPQYETLEDSFVFAPVKVCVDRAGRVYAIVKNVYEGIMSFDSDGTFFGYFGTIKVNYNPADWFWRQISTAAQRAKQRLFIPVEFSSMDIDASGFIYATNIDIQDGNKVKRLNPSGEDVLINYTKLKINGDQRWRMTGRYGGRTVFSDIKSRPNGMYSALDTTRGRLYTYDSEGNLLYVIGGTGNTLGMGRRPVAVEVLDGNILILDQQRGEIVYFEETEYGRLVNEAISLRYNGDESSAVEKWRQVLSLNENYTLAYTGIGKALLAAGENKEAMSYLKKGMSVEYYSVAFKRYRNDVMKENMGWFLTLLMLAVAAFIGYYLYRSIRRHKVRRVTERIENQARYERLMRQQALNEEAAKREGVSE